MSWIVFFAGVGLLMIFRGRSPKLLAPIMWAVLAFLAFVTGAALANIALGQWAAALMAGLFGWVGGWVGTSGAIVGGLVLLLVVIVVVLDLLDRTADTPAIAGLIVVPLLIVAAAGGPIADAASQLYAAAETLGMSSLGQLVGG